MRWLRAPFFSSKSAKPRPSASSSYGHVSQCGLLPSLPLLGTLVIALGLCGQSPLSRPLTESHLQSPVCHVRSRTHSFWRWGRGRGLTCPPGTRGTRLTEAERSGELPQRDCCSPLSARGSWPCQQGRAATAQHPHSSHGSAEYRGLHHIVRRVGALPCMQQKTTSTQDTEVGTICHVAVSSAISPWLSRSCRPPAPQGVSPAHG